MERIVNGLLKMLHGEGRRVRWWASPIILIVGAPAIVVLAAAVFIAAFATAVAFVATLLFIPAAVANWLLSAELHPPEEAEQTTS